MKPACVCVWWRRCVFPECIGSAGDEYLMTVPPLLGAQTDDLLTFRHPDLDELLRAGLSVSGAAPAPGGISSRVYLPSHLAQTSINGHHLLIGHF